jgi:putative ABC transport system permease protein
MPLSEVLRLSFESILAQKFRAALTMLGLLVGVLAVVLLVSIGDGTKKFISAELEGLGINFIIVQPGKTDRKGGFGPPPGVSQREMTTADVKALERRSFNLAAVTGLVLGSTSLRYNDNIVNVSVFGTNERFIDIFNLKVGLGNFLSKEDQENSRRVVVIGSKIAKSLFDLQNPLGKQIKVNFREFRVIGVLASSGSKLGLNLDEVAFIPTNSALKAFNETKLFGIRAKAKSRNNLPEAVEEIRNILKERRNGEEDFTIATQKEMMETLTSILDMLTYVLAGIAAISMIVGGVGIMNIMLVSVSERTSEIGIRRAVGARQIDIIKQFMAEAMLLSIIGGTLGLALSFVFTNIFTLFYPDFNPTPPNWILGPAFIFSVAVGVIFGVYPAVKAAKIEPLDALRQGLA